MIKKLKLRFMLYSLLSFVSVLLIILISINVTNIVNTYNDMSENANGIVIFMQTTDLNIDEELRPTGPNGSENGLDEVTPEDPVKRDFSKGPLARFVIYNSVTDAYNYKFYGAIANSEEISETFNLVSTFDDSEGRTGNYYYIKDNNMTYLLDVTDRVSNMKNVLIISLYVFIAAFILVVILMYFASNRVIRPFIVANKKQKEFITNAGHELKTPLTIINTDNTLIEMDFGESEQTKSISRQVKRLSSLTNDLVSLSRLDEGVLLNKKELDLGNLIKELTIDFEIEAKAKNKELNVSSSSYKYIGDAGLIKKLISILIDNSLKYADNQSIIYIKQKQNIIIVENKASDLAAGDKSQFFERFYRADESRNSQIRGHGIGLSLAKSIVELHKGKIEANQSSSRTFTIKVWL